MRLFWTEADIALLIEKYADTPTAALAQALGRRLRCVYSKARYLALHKSEGYMASEQACRLRRGDNVGAAFRFKKGNVPANKGIKGISHEGSRATQFKPGQKTHTWKPIGSERLNTDGYLRRKVTETGYSRRDWQAVHVLTWIEHHGAVPAGHVVAFRDGNKQHIAIENLELLTQRENMARNTIARYSPEMRGAMKLLKKARRKLDEQQEHQ